MFCGFKKTFKGCLDKMNCSAYCSTQTGGLRKVVTLNFQEIRTSVYNSRWMTTVHDVMEVIPLWRNAESNKSGQRFEN